MPGPCDISPTLHNTSQRFKRQHVSTFLFVLLSWNVNHSPDTKDHQGPGHVHSEKSTLPLERFVRRLALATLTTLGWVTGDFAPVDAIAQLQGSPCTDAGDKNSPRGKRDGSIP